jgi:hypothetical protein
MAPQRPSVRRLRWGILGSVLVLACAILPTAALADDAPPAVQQYVENVPTGGGPQAQGATHGRTTLPAGVQRSLMLEGGKDTVSLRDIATAAQIGAPTASLAANESSDGPNALVLEILISLLGASLLGAAVWRLRSRFQRSAT